MTPSPPLATILLIAAFIAYNSAVKIEASAAAKVGCYCCKAHMFVHLGAISVYMDCGMDLKVGNEVCSDLLAWAVGLDDFNERAHTDNGVCPWWGFWCADRPYFGYSQLVLREESMDVFPLR